jgi:hypothetical protein
MKSSVQFTYAALIVFGFISHRVHCFSSGTGSCIAGEAPLAGPGTTHVRPDQILGPLSEYQVEFLVNDVVIPPDTPTTFEPNVDLTWTVRTNNPIQYRGILVRVEAPETTPFTVTGNGDQLKEDLSYCPGEPGNVIGITHTGAGLKPSSSGVLRFDTAGTATVDITVVYRNGSSGTPPDNQSVTGYNRFSLNIEAAQVPVAPPVVPPTDAPVAPPTDVPVAVPVEVPIEPPVEVPIESPVEVPTDQPVELPTEPPVEAPTESPVELPIEAPTELPVETPTELPVEVPTESPVEVPTESPVTAPVEVPVEKPTKQPKVMGMGMGGEKGMGKMDTKGMTSSLNGKVMSSMDAKGMGKMGMKKLRYLR